MARQLNQMQDWARETRLTQARVVVLATLMLVVMVGLLYRYFYLQIVQNETFRAQSDRNRIAVRAVAPTRGVIVDREGRLLAENLPSFTLALTPERISNLEETLVELTDLLDLSEDDIALFSETRRRTRPLSPVPLKYRLSESERAMLAVNKHRFEGMSILTELTRNYPEGALLGHAIGYVVRNGKDEIAHADTERYRSITHISKDRLAAYYESLLPGELSVSLIVTNDYCVDLRAVNSV